MGVGRQRGMTTEHVVRQESWRARDHHTDVTAWRLRRLLEAGFDVVLADELATTPGIDLHALLDLVDRGCPPDLASRILSPLDDPDPRP